MFLKLLPDKKSLLIWFVVGLVLFGLLVAMGVPPNIAPLVSLIVTLTISMVKDYVTHHVGVLIHSYRFSAKMKIKEKRDKHIINKAIRSREQVQPLLDYYKLQGHLNEHAQHPNAKTKKRRLFRRLKGH